MFEVKSVVGFYREKWWNRELTLNCKFKCYVKPMKDPLGVSHSEGNQGTTRGKEKILLISVGIEPTTSGFYRDSLLVIRLSCRPIRSVIILALNNHTPAILLSLVWLQIELNFTQSNHLYLFLY